jgi:hypothetical protein
MIKLTDLLNEVDDDLLDKGFKLGKATVDPETGSSTSDVEYLPQFEQIRRQALSMRKEFQPFKFSANEDIAKVAKDINTNLTKVSQLIFALDKMIELQKKNK